MNKPISFVYIALTLLIPAGVMGCGSPPRADPPINLTLEPPPQAGPVQIAPAPPGVRLQAVDMNNPVAPSPLAGSVKLAAARNEWVSFAVNVAGLPKPGSPAPGSGLALAVRPFLRGSGGGRIEPSNATFYEVLPMPVDVNRAGYVRHTGLSAGNRDLPRALLPLPSSNGSVDVATLRDPARATDPAARAGGEAGAGGTAVLIWVDLHVPVDARPGNYSAAFEASPLRPGTAAASETASVSVPIELTVYGFTLPAERHLQMVSRVDWDSLERLYPNKTEAITPRLINRHDPAYAPLVQTLDAMVKTAQQHRANLVVPRLQPTVKWAAGEPPQVDWEDFDSLVGPWLTGEAFADRQPMGFWPTPSVDYLDNYDPLSQQQYWNRAAVHFSQENWLDRTAVFLENPPDGAADAARDEPSRLVAARSLSAAAARTLASHPLLRVTAPLEEDQLVLAQPGQPETAGMIEPQTTNRLATASPGLVRAPPPRPWPAGVARPEHWLRTDLPGLVPYVGAGADERDVRLWAWLAYLRGADLILWTGALPPQNDPNTPADPNALVWFYPGDWFGVDAPVPSVQLKWLRRAQQDYEYLWLATRRKQQLNALVMARLMTRQVEISPGQDPDPTYALLSGTTDQKVWDEALGLLARTILLREPGEPLDETKFRALNVDMNEWQAPKERPFLIPRSVDWRVNPRRADVLNVTLGIDVYNASDRSTDGAADGSRMAWTGATGGWQFSPEPLDVPRLETYGVARVAMAAKYDLARTPAAGEKSGTAAGSGIAPVSVTFVDGFTRERYTNQAVVPVANSDRREGRLAIDGALDDWDVADRVQEGPMVKALDRPALHRQKLAFATTISNIYTCWGEENFYVAFKLGGVSARDVLAYSNFANYQFRRAWGEDLCEILVQAVYPDNALGAVLHVVCKPNAPWTEKKPAGAGDDAWAPWEGAAIRYAATLDPSNNDWRGEVAIPWKAIVAEGKGRPKLLRFNFTQHQKRSGETASWAGPIDFGRDDRFMGLLNLREPAAPGMGKPAQ